MPTRLIRTCAAIALMLIPAAGHGQNSCSSLQKLISQVYNFKPSNLSADQRTTKSAEMDKVWATVKANPQDLAPCLVSALNDPQANSWFKIDGSRLLVEVDPSPASKVLQVKYWTSADLNDVNLQDWVQTLAARGAEGFDVSEGGRRWLEFPKARYFLPLHSFEVRAAEGSLFIFGSMDEAQATPALLKIVAQKDHPGREAALWILTAQATAESLRGLKQLDTSEFSPEARASVRALLERPELIERNPNPKLTRADFLRVFESAANMDRSRIDQLAMVVNRDDKQYMALIKTGSTSQKDEALSKLEQDRNQLTLMEKPWKDFTDLLWGGQPTEQDAVAVLKTEDLPLIRKLRRQMITYCNQHAISNYMDLTQLIMTMVWKPELVH